MHASIHIQHSDFSMHVGYEETSQSKIPKCQICVQNMGSVSYYVTPTQTIAWGSWLCWRHQEDKKVQRSTPRYTERIRASRAFGKTEVKEPKCLDLVRINLFFETEDARGGNQRSVGRVRVRHPGSLQVLLVFPPGRKYSMT